ncbi:hypothetical protein GIB67_030539 [Kingdonia uniflora]|uniref:Uncharacterized protein n=1 Tax=Kingdonia uniflora TaxID=39325 RepID=A0A7J7L4W6_9MAGN|nr:hypothetical protein GIB67_030539 [Kingdonia uniflora]
MGGECKHQVSCPIYELDGHKADSCPWVYSRSKMPNYNGIMWLLIYKTLKNPNKKFLLCQLIEYNAFEWLSDATKDGKEEIGSSSTTGYYGCGGTSHWVKDCPWRLTKCPVEGCPGQMKLQISKQDGTKGKKSVKTSIITSLFG